MMYYSEQFPFGAPVMERAPQIFETRYAYVLGAYPSALHVLWQPLGAWRSIQALAVDNEPDFFWNGKDEEQQIRLWKGKVNYQSVWGRVSGVGRLNGSSGLWVEEKVLLPLSLTRGVDVWISDCLTTYRASEDQSKRLSDTYNPFADSLRLPKPCFSKHPSEREIVKEALATQTSRLLQELDCANPDLIVTLGNSALQVLSQIVNPTIPAPAKLTEDMLEYGRPIEVVLKTGKRSVWYPLVHPGQRTRYQDVHQQWMRNIGKQSK